MRRRHGGIAEGRVALQLLDHLFIFFGRLYGAYAEGYDFHAAQLRPFFGQHIIERIGDFGSMSRQGAIANAHIGNLRERGLQRGEQLGFQLAIDLIAGVIALHIAADVYIEQHGVRDAIAVFAEAADGNIHIQTDIAIHHAERNRTGRTVFIADDFLGIEEVHALIAPGLAAEGEALIGGAQNLFQIFAAEAAAENAGFAVDIEDVFARLGAEIHDLALIHDQHALAFVYRDGGAGGDYIIILYAAAAEATLRLLARAGCQHIIRHRVRIEIILPLAGKRAARGVQSCSDQSHMNNSPLILFYV